MSPPHSRTTLCPDLQFLVDMERQSGNKLSRPPQQADWPREGAVFAALTRDMQLQHYRLPDAVDHAICTDPRYGWHDECHCRVHGDLLVAGTTHAR
jgi:hypothetical protein